MIKDGIQRAAARLAASLDDSAEKARDLARATEEPPKTLPWGWSPGSGGAKNGLSREFKEALFDGRLAELVGKKLVFETDRKGRAKITVQGEGGVVLTTVYEGTYSLGESVTLMDIHQAFNVRVF